MLCQQESLLSHEDPLESAIIDLHVHISRQRHGRTADSHRKRKSTDTLTPNLDSFSCTLLFKYGVSLSDSTSRGSSRLP